MLKKKDVVETKELKEFKFMREQHLCQRRINMSNHAFDHRCNDYCWRNVTMKMKYDVVQHAASDGECYTDEGGIVWIKMQVKECRLGFGYQLKFPTTCGDRTGGAQPVQIATITYDGNGMPTLVPQRNHPRIVAEPTLCYHWGANMNAKIFLVNNSTLANASANGRDYGDFIRNLHIAKMPGLEQFIGSDTVARYSCGYSCKGNQTSAAFNEDFKTMTENVAADNPNASQRTVVMKVLRTVLSQTSCPNDEAQFYNAGGEVSYNTVDVKGCSLNSVPLDNLTGDTSEKSFTAMGLKKYYAHRTEDYKNLSFYLYIAHTKGIASNFFGFNDKATWPLREEFAKAILILHWPHACHDLATLKVEDSFAKGLEAVMHDDNFPKRILADILRRKSKWKFERSEAEQYDVVPENSATVQQRTDSTLQEAAGAAAEAALGAGVNPDEGEESDTDFRDRDFDGLCDGGVDHHWNTSFDESALTWLLEKKEAYYFHLHATDANDNFTLHDVNIYKPENARGRAQELLVGTCLLSLKENIDYSDSPTTVEPPPSYRI
jgi:hypothetical protein